MRTKLGILAAGLGVFCLALSVAAHHGFDTEYDAKKFVKLEGVIKEVTWTNPHMRIYIDVTDASGKKVNWGFEGTTPTALIRSGFKRDALKPGDRVTVKGVHSRDMTVNRGAASQIVLESTGQAFTVGGGGQGNN